MTSRPAARWTSLFRFVSGQQRGPRVRRSPLFLEVLESRVLPSSDVWNFVSAPDLHPMKVSVQVQQPGTAPGLVFTAPYALGTLVGQDGALIMDNAGNPVWFLPVSNNNQEQVGDFRVQSYLGQPVLTFWQGQIAGTVPSDLPDGVPLPGGQFYVYNQHYQQLFAVTAADGFTSDFHEFLLTQLPNGHPAALFAAVKQVFANLTPYGGAANGSYVDHAVQEIDLQTGQLVFNWVISDHIPLSASIEPAPTSASTVWDPYHLNSIDTGPNGELVLSARDTWAVFEISNPALPGGGQVLWQIGGMPENQWPQFSIANDITGPFNTAFQWQHDAQFQPGTPPGTTVISLFDDACCDSPYPDPFSPAQGEIINLNFGTLTATVLKTYPHDPSLFPDSQGDVQALSNGDEFLGWGAEPYYSEYTQSGTVLYDALMPGEDVSYRTFRNVWVGLPLTNPSVAVQEVNGQPVVFASWNGSTQTTAWELLAGPDADHLSPISTIARTGFETALSAPVARFYEVEALDANGNVIGTSEVVSTPITAAYGTDAGVSQVNLYDATGTLLIGSLNPFPATFTGGVRTALADVNGDSVKDVICAAGPGGGPQVTVFEGQTLQLIRSFYAFAPAFSGGVFVAAGDLNGDGFADVICGADAGGGPQVAVYSGKDGSLLASFYAFNPSFRGGVRVAFADVNGQPEIVCAAGPGGGPQVTVFDGQTFQPVLSFYAFAPGFAGGVFVAAGDLGSNGIFDIVCGAGPGGGPQIALFRAQDASVLASFYDPRFSSTTTEPGVSTGIRVGVVPTVGLAEILAAPGPGSPGLVDVFNGRTLALIDEYFAFDPSYRGGVFVGG